MAEMWKVEGAAELAKALEALPLKLERKTWATALRAGAKVILPMAKSIVPKVSGTWAASLKVKSFKKRKKGTVGVMVQSAAGDYQGEAFYGSFVELGHKWGRRPSRKKNDPNDKRRKIEGKWYLRNAALRMEAAVKATIERELWAGIDAAMKK